MVKCDIEMKNKETLFCEPAQRTKSYVTGEQKGVDTVIRSMRILGGAGAERVLYNIQNIHLLARARVNIYIIGAVLVTLELVGKNFGRFAKGD